MDRVVSVGRLVGRQHELAALDQALRGARAGNGGTVFLVGDDGVGKSRLAREVAAQAISYGMSVFRGRCGTIGSAIRLRPFIEITMQIRRRAPRESPEWRDMVEDVLTQLVPNGRARWPESLVLLADALLRRTSAAGRHDGCLLVVEDLHAADPDTLSVLDYLADNLDHEPTLLVTTVNPVPGDGIDLVRAAARRGTGQVLELGGLSRDEVGELLAWRLGPDVPAGLLEDVWDGSAGNPFVVEELLRGGVSRVLVDDLVRRVTRLGPQSMLLFSVAAVLGQRFPLSVARRAAGLDDDVVRVLVGGGVAAGLVSADRPAPDWYRFGNRLIRESLLRRMTPADRAALAGRATDALAGLHPGLPGDWRALAATLLTEAGDLAGAARVLVGAAAAGPVGAAPAAPPALAELERAWTLAVRADDPELRAEVLAPLLAALAAAGQVERAGWLVDAVDDLSVAGVPAARLAAVHTGLAVVAATAGRWADGRRHVATARAVLGWSAAERDRVGVDVAEAGLVGGDAGDELARRAVIVAQEAELPDVACQAWQVLGRRALWRGSNDAVRCFEALDVVAKRHRLPLWTTVALAGLGVTDWLAHGGLRRLELARDRAARLGAVPLRHSVTTTLALAAVLAGRFADAADLLDAVWRDVTMSGLDEHARQVLAVRAVAAAHQGRPPDLADFERYGGEQAHLVPLTHGLARAFGALLDEDRGAAREHLARAAGHPLGGEHGLRVFSAVLAGDDVTTEHPVADLPWNRQFVLLADAVRFGRRGCRAEAEAAVAQAEEVGGGFPVAWHLGLRLVAEAAQEARWGDPVAWLRAAEEYFHAAGIAAVAGACRALLRRTGVAVPRRRPAGRQIPASLRVLGVTAREYEVLELLADRSGNRVIANRLHISPRTVEKHVAALLNKIGQPNRWELVAYAAGIRE